MNISLSERIYYLDANIVITDHPETGEPILRLRGECTQEQIDYALGSCNMTFEQPREVKSSEMKYYKLKKEVANGKEEGSEFRGKIRGVPVLTGSDGGDV